MIGYKNIPVSGSTIYSGYVKAIVGLTYVREGSKVEFLEGWINPYVPLTDIEKRPLVESAKATLIHCIKTQMEKYPDKERSWEGVTHG